MKLSALLHPKRIRCGLVARTKDDALGEMLQLTAAYVPGVPLEDLKLALAEREKVADFRIVAGTMTGGEVLQRISGSRA